MKISNEMLAKFILLTMRVSFLVIWLVRMLTFFRKMKVILVFGMSRSGTTMLGKFLSYDPSVVYIHEPEKDYLLYRYKWEKSNNPGVLAFWQYSFSEEQKQFKVHGLICVFLRALLETPKTVKTVCIKPIYLLDVMEEAAAALNFANIVYISRHPCGRIDSILRQRQLDEQIDPATFSLDYFEKLGHSWGETNKQVQGWFQKHPDWNWVLFENLSYAPLEEFKKLYALYGLSWDEQVEGTIKQLTEGEDGGFYDVKRNSRAQADKWREALTEEQVSAIRRGCLPFETNLYESF